ncbi:hypothetical protein XCR_3143 [Xanthomonas campestris pv. raphani 756C]|nr:hypothetical protein XCR_3143 [Xanthomonas campestris pv. raphani 756C]
MRRFAPRALRTRQTVHADGMYRLNSATALVIGSMQWRACGDYCGNTSSVAT